MGILLFMAISMFWMSNHKAISINISEDLTTTQITSTLPAKFDIETVALLLIAIILISLFVVVFIQFTQKKKIIAEIQSISEEMLKQSIKPIAKEYSYLEFENIKKSYNEKINHINEQVKAKDEYFNMTIHDLRSPIQAVKNSLAMLEKFPEDKETVDDLKEEVRHLENEVSRYLILEKIDYFEKPQIRSVNLEVFFKSLVKKYVLDANIIEIKTKPDYYRAVDIQMFEKVVMNLIQNALQYSSDGRLQIEFGTNHLVFSNKVSEPVGKIFNTERSKNCCGNGIGTQIVLKYLSLQELSISEEHGQDRVNIKIIFKD